MTVDEELLKELRDLLTNMDGMRELSESEALAVVDEVGRQFIDNKENVWWWQSLKCASISLPYNDADGLVLFGELLPDGGTIRLVVTDDEPRPWPVFEGETRKVWELISNLRVFEYFITTEDSRSVVFDTHHNALVAAGLILAHANLHVPHFR
jgi:hypothetical protein